jgi:hypothetical protein
MPIMYTAAKKSAVLELAQGIRPDGKSRTRTMRLNVASFN